MEFSWVGLFLCKAVTAREELDLCCDDVYAANVCSVSEFCRASDLRRAMACWTRMDSNALHVNNFLLREEHFDRLDSFSHPRMNK